MDNRRNPSLVIGKRRNYEGEDALEPPRKSPIGTPMGSPIVEQGMNDFLKIRRSLQGSRDFEKDGAVPVIDNSCHQPSPTNANRPVKKAVYRRRSLSPTVNHTWNTRRNSSAGADSQNSDWSVSPQLSDNEHGDTFDSNFTGVSNSYDANPSSLPMSFTIYRGDTTPVRTTQTTKTRLRRRSSCKELTLYIMRRESVNVDQNKPIFRTIETLRRMSMQQTTTEETISATASPLDSPMVARKRISVSTQSSITRSLSAEGYDADEVREQQWDAHTLMFDSVPDLSADDSHERIAALKKNRRGAVCYDLDHAAVLLGNLNLVVDEDG